MVKYEGRYSLIGVISVSPSSELGGCDSPQFGIFTRVSAYTDDFLLEKTLRYAKNY